MQNDGNIFKDSERQKKRHEDFSAAINNSKNVRKDPDALLLAKQAADINVRKIKESYDPLIKKPAVSSFFLAFNFARELLSPCFLHEASSLITCGSSKKGAVLSQSVTESEELLDILDWDEADLAAFLVEEDW